MFWRVVLTAVCVLGIGSLDALIGVTAWNFLLTQPPMLCWLLGAFVVGPALAWVAFGSWQAVRQVWRWSACT